MKKLIIKGMNYTEIQTKHSVQYIALQRDRKATDCGVWVDGVLVQPWNDMGTPIKLEWEYPLKRKEVQYKSKEASQ